MTLGPVDIFNGLLSIVIVSTYFVVGLNIASRYFQYKQKEFLYLGMCWAGISSPWWPSSVTFIMYLATEATLPLRFYLIIGNVFIPFLLHMWIAGLSNLIFKKWKKKLLILNGIIGIIFEIGFFLCLRYDVSLLGELQSAVDIKYSSFLLVYIGYVIGAIILSGLLLAIYSIKTKDEELELKGKLLIIGLISWVVGAIMDAALSLNFVTLPISRSILVFGAIGFYSGLVMPSWVKKLFLKSTNHENGGDASE